MLEHQNLLTQDVVLEKILGMSPPPTNYTEMTTEEDHCKIGLLDHDYGVVEYPFQTVVPTGDFEVMMTQEFSTVLIS